MRIVRPIHTEPTAVRGLIEEQMWIKQEGKALQFRVSYLEAGECR
jgi:hypothetical protein